MIKAEEHSYLSSYQPLTIDKNRRSYQSPKKLVKATAAKLLTALPLVAQICASLQIELHASLITFRMFVR
jgi:hypothetical protein